MVLIVSAYGLCCDSLAERLQQAEETINQRVIVATEAAQAQLQQTLEK
jgi:hypothetical protein